MSDNTLYVLRDPAGNIYGPATIPTLRAWYQQGRIVGTMQIAPQGSAVWQPLPIHPGMADLFAPGTHGPIAGSTTPPTPATGPATSGTVATPPSTTPQPTHTPPATPHDDAAIDHARRAVGGFFRELYHLSPMAFWGGILSAAGIVVCCGCGAILGILGALMGVLALDRGPAGETAKLLDPKVKKGAMVAIGLGVLSLLTNCLGLGILQTLHNWHWFGL